MRRPAAVAGTFYPDDAERLKRQIDAFLAEAMLDVGSDPIRPKAIIAPHAGTIYSGPIAASAYATVDPGVRRVVLLGPAHRVALHGIAASTAEAFETPLGSIPLDRTMLDELVSVFPFVVADDAAHAEEHSIELQLPFLQRCVNTFQLVPLVVGRASEEEVAAVLSAVWGGEETLVVCSTDLSHFHSDAEARRIDTETADMILQGKASLIDGERACGYVGLRGLLRRVASERLDVSMVDLRNSSDTAGDRRRVVGYASFVVTP